MTPKAASRGRALRERMTPFQLHFYGHGTEHDLMLFPPLIVAAHPASGVPQYAAFCLGNVFLSAEHGGVAMEAARACAATCARELIPALLAIMAHDLAVGEACAALEEDVVFDADDATLHSSNVARLLLLLLSFAPSETAEALCSGNCVQLLAARVLHARAFDADERHRRFTPLLHRALLTRARDTDTEGINIPVLATVASACLREMPALDSAHESRTQEAHVAVMCVLLVCGIAGDAGLDEPALAAAGQWLAKHVDWLLHTLADMADAALGVPDVAHPLAQRLHGAPQKIKMVARDAALHVAALPRVPALAAVLWGSPAFPACMRRLLAAPWVTGPDSKIDALEVTGAAAAAAAAYGSLATILACTPQRDYLAVTWALADVVALRTTPEHVESAFAARAALHVQMAAILRVEARLRAALATASTHALALLRILEADLSDATAMGDVRRTGALGALLHVLRPGNGDDLELLRVAAEELYLAQLQLVDDTHATAEVLGRVASACAPHLLVMADVKLHQWLRYSALMACAMAGSAVVARSPGARSAVSWLVENASLVFSELAVASNPINRMNRSAKFPALSDAALLLKDASQVGALVHAFVRYQDFGPCAAKLLFISWSGNGRHGETCRAAAAYYTALAGILAAAPRDALQQLAAACAGPAVQMAHLRPVGPKVLLPQSAGLHDALAHLCRESSRLADARDAALAGRNDDAEQVAQDALVAMTQLRRVLYALRPLDVNAVYNALVASRRECMDESEEEN